MPRPRRTDLPGIPKHVVQRGNDRQPCFFAEAGLPLLSHDPARDRTARGLRGARLSTDDQPCPPAAYAAAAQCRGAHLAVARTAVCPSPFFAPVALQGIHSEKQPPASRRKALNYLRPLLIPFDRRTLIRNT